MEFDNSISATAIKIHGKYYALIVVDEGPNCCKVVRTHCEKENGQKICKQEGKLLCDDAKRKGACESVKKYVKKQEKEKKKERKSEEKEGKGKEEEKEREEKKGKDKKAENGEKGKKTEEEEKEVKVQKDKKINSEKGSENTSEQKEGTAEGNVHNDEFDEDEEDYDSSEEAKENKDAKDDKEVSKSKTVNELDKDEIIRLAKALQKYPKDKAKNPKCTKKAAFRCFSDTLI